MDIEQVAREEPAALVRLPIDPVDELTDDHVAAVVNSAGLQESPVSDGTGTAARLTGRHNPALRLADTVRAVWRLYRSADATLIEINPLVITVTGDVLALDAKVTIDDNALYRQPDVARLRDLGDERERRAREAGLTYVSLDGDVGVLGNGAGLVMSTLDLIAAAGGHAANFCDVGGGARAEAIAAAFEIVATDDRVHSVLVSIFGGITRGDEVAAGLLVALDRERTTLPIVVRLDGTGAAAGREALTAAAYPDLTVAATVDEAVATAVTAAGSGASASGHPSAEERPTRS